MGGITKCCCGDGIDCSDRSVLPETFEIDFGASLGTTTIDRADWTGNTGTSPYCCWVYEITHDSVIAFALREYKCSDEIPYSYTQGQKLVSYRYRVRTIVHISTGATQCDAQSSATNQYVVTIIDEYAGRVGVAIYDYPSPACAVLAIGLDGIFGFGVSFSQLIQRAKYFASLAAGTYTIAPTDLAECIPACHILDTSENSLTLTDIPTGLSVTWDDPADWEFVTT
jgi:hypothetical protein